MSEHKAERLLGHAPQILSNLREKSVQNESLAQPFYFQSALGNHLLCKIPLSLFVSQVSCTDSLLVWCIILTGF